MKKQKYKMQEIYEGLYDGPHATPPVSDSGAIFLGISNITPDGHIDYSDIRYINEIDLPKWTKRVTPKGGDIVFSYEATLNLYAIIPDGFWGCLGRRMALIRPDESKALGKYLFYYFYSDEWRATIAENTIAGSTVDRIPIAKFPEFPITLPDLSVQKKIADALSVYDDLIENSQKQIKLLEEAAQRLYKEWFVDFRFPGHEDIEIVDGIPKGWRMQPIDDVFSIKYGKTLPTSKISSVGKYPVYGASKVIGFYNDKNCENYSVLITSRGDAGNVYRTHHKESFITNNSFIVSPLLDYLHNPFIYFQMVDLDFKAITTGSCQPQLTNNSISRKTVLLPSEKILRLFNKLADRLFDQVEIKMQEITQLSEARDRLLSKLMSGEIEL